MPVLLIYVSHVHPCKDRLYKRSVLLIQLIHTQHLYGLLMCGNDGGNAMICNNIRNLFGTILNNLFSLIASAFIFSEILQGRGNFV